MRLYNINDHKPQLLDWLAARAGIKYKHSFRDQWIIPMVWDGKLSVIFDSRVPEQMELNRILEGKVRSVDISFSEFEIDYPTITNKKIIGKVKHKDNDGDAFYVYTWLCDLSDGTQLEFENQDANALDIEKWTYPSAIEERFLIREVCAVKHNLI